MKIKELGRTVPIFNFHCSRANAIEAIKNYSGFPVWLEKASLKVIQIKGKVGGVANAWTIIRGQGLDKVDAWLEKAEAKVEQIKDSVGGKRKAWKFVIEHGAEEKPPKSVAKEGTDMPLDKVDPAALQIAHENAAVSL